MSKQKEQSKTHLHRLSDEEIFHLCEQYAMLFSSGFTPLTASQIMEKDADNGPLIPVLKDLEAALSEGSLFSESIKKTGAFPTYVSELVQVGEQTGHLDDVCSSLSDYYEQEANLRESVRQAVSYPIIMVVMMFVVVIVLLSSVLPIFRQVFEELGTSMQGITAVLMDISTTLSHYYAVLVTIFMIFAAAFYYFYHSRRGQQQFRRFLGVFPPTREFSRRLAVQRMAEAMKMTITAGIDPYRCLYLTGGIISDQYISDKIQTCKKIVLAGGSLSEALVQSGIYNSFYSSMITVSSRSGRLDETLGFIADHYKADTDRRISRVLNSIEPTMVAVLSIVIAIILLSVILPLMGVMSTIG